MEEVQSDVHTETEPISKPMTPYQLERAARHYCKLMGMDAEGLAPHEPTAHGVFVEVYATHSPRWKIKAEQLRIYWAMNEALKEGMRDPNVDGALEKPFDQMPVSDTTDA